MEKEHCVIIHYAEIALKGHNRAFFEKALLLNIKKQAEGLYEKIVRISGRLVLYYAEEKKEEITKALGNVFGIHHFEFGRVTGADMQSMQVKAREMFVKKEKKSFRVTASRAEKQYPFTSQEIEREVGRVIHEELGFPVSLDNPEIVLAIEVVENKAYLLGERVEGLGGLPVGVSGKVVVLLSNGFDSPVAALRMMKRGCLPILLHFHSYPYTSKDALENVYKLRDILSRYSPKQLELIEIPFSGIQQFLAIKVPSEFRIVMYRRWMLWIAEHIARQKKAHALVTGDSVGQVASQTLENIETISEIAALPVLRPLAGTDKEEIIDMARAYGTHDISKLPYDDCCSLFMEGSPRTKTTVEEIKKIEEPLRLMLEEKALQAIGGN
ncbi:MAG: tRNA 4-thiouridine(8) synthase ThiI [Candidatus Niyogibacteria bacterium]|nr:tRNA 4-thiouridine(8) synthase ThiI [Candidatus Niyogibacteria bacterium]